MGNASDVSHERDAGGWYTHAMCSSLGGWCLREARVGEDEVVRVEMKPTYYAVSPPMASVT